MSPMQAVVRPSALPVLKTYQNGTLSGSDAASSPENDSAPSPIYDRQRRAGSTPTRSIPAPGFFRTSVARHAASTIHINSLNNNNNPSKLKTQMSLTTIRSTKNVGVESPKEALSRRHSARANNVVSASVSSSNQNGRFRTSEINPSSLNPVKNAASVSSSSNNATTSTNNQKSNLARCSITRAIVAKLQPNTTTTTKTKGTIMSFNLVL